MGEGLKRGRRGPCKREEVMARMVVLMSSVEGRWLSMTALARKLGVSRDTVRAYMTPELMADVDARKALLDTADGGLAAVDAAMLAQAQQGNVAAARLVYARQAGVVPSEALPTLGELEEMVKRLREAGSKGGRE